MLKACRLAYDCGCNLLANPFSHSPPTSRLQMSVCLLLSFWLVFANDKTQDVVAIFMPGTHGNYLFENIIMLLFLDQLVYDAICGTLFSLVFQLEPHLPAGRCIIFVF